MFLWLFSSALLAFAGMAYELAFAQLLSLTLGNTVLQYGLIVGIFILFMGIGALLSEIFPVENEAALKRLSFLQIGIVSIILLSPHWIIAFDPALSGSTALWILIAASYLPPALTGLLTGFELPDLMRLSGGRSQIAVLSSDYVGMFAGAISFPLLLLPSFGVFSVFTITAAVNAFFGLIFALILLLNYGNSGPIKAISLWSIFIAAFLAFVPTPTTQLLS